MKLRDRLDVIFDALSIANRTHSMTSVRLHLLRYRVPPRVGGTFRFRFGRVRYVDAWSLQAQYEEIFTKRGYEVTGLGDNPHIIDCGGNIGLSVIWFKRRYPGARITVFEADPALAEILDMNVRRCGLRSVEVVRAAVGADSTPVTFVPEGSDMGYVGAGPGIAVRSVRLSECLCRPVDLLKVDIEGSEYALLGDLCATGRIALVKNIVCEVHGRGAVQEQAVRLWDDLGQAGFRLTVAGARVTPFVPGPPEPTPFPGAGSGKFVLHLYAWRP
jgi:FkbM family methyltransferase